MRQIKETTGDRIQTPGGPGEIVSNRMADTVLVIHRRPPEDRSATKGAFYFRMYDKDEIKPKAENQ